MRRPLLPPIKIQPQRAVGLLIVGMALLQLGVMLFTEPDTSGTYPPVWMVAVLVSAFLWVGLGVMSKEGGKTQGLFFTLTLFAFLFGMFLVLNWGAFAPGVRECSASISIPFFGLGGAAPDLGCRFFLGSLAIVADALLVLGLAQFVAWSWDFAPWTQRVVLPAKFLVGLSLLPLSIIVLAALLLAKTGEFWQGQWDRLRARRGNQQ